MEIVVNGETMQTEAASITEFLRSVDIDPVRVAVELNLDILPKNEYDTTILQEGDRLEIVQFVGGGQERKNG